MNLKAQRIYEARRAGLVARIGHGVGPERAEQLASAWEVEAERIGLARDTTGYWDEAGRWIETEIERTRRR